MPLKSVQGPDVIFTYGTLRPGLGDVVEAHEFRATAKHLGPASFQGKLYAIDWYPGAIDSADPADVVIGDLFQFGKHADFFVKLDTYEGCTANSPDPHEYMRVIRTISVNGQPQLAWIYLYNWAVTDQNRIESGDFADFLSAR